MGSRERGAGTYRKGGGGATGLSHIARGSGPLFGLGLPVPQDRELGRIPIGLRDNRAEFMVVGMALAETGPVDPALGPFGAGGAFNV